MREDVNWKVVATLVAVFFSFYFLYGWWYETQTTAEVAGIVTDQYIKRTGFGKSAKDTFFIVIQKDSGEIEILENSDSLFQWKWNSADFQQEMEIGKTYTFKVYGYRIPFLTWFRNIYTFEILEE